MTRVRQSRIEAARPAGPSPRAPDRALRSRGEAGTQASLKEQVRGVGYQEGVRRLSPKGGPAGSVGPGAVGKSSVPGDKTDPHGMEVEPVDFKNPRSRRPGNAPKGSTGRPGKGAPRGLQVEPVDIRPIKDR